MLLIVFPIASLLFAGGNGASQLKLFKDSTEPFRKKGAKIKILPIGEMYLRKIEPFWGGWMEEF